MARVIVTDASAFLPGVAPQANAATRGLWTRRDELADQATKLAIARDRLRLEEDKDASTAVKGRYDVLSSAFNMGDPRGAAVEALMERGRGMRPVPAKMMPMAGEGPAIDIMVPAPGSLGDTGRSTTALREDLEDARARERFEAARASRDEESMDIRERATRSLMPTPAATPAVPVSPRDTAPMVPATVPAIPTPAPAADEFAVLGAASPRARRDSLRYKDYSDRDLGDQIIEMVNLAVATDGSFDERKAARLREEIVRRPNRALIEGYINKEVSAATAPAATGRVPVRATGPTAPGAMDVATGERARDITRAGVTVPQYARLEEEVLAPGAQRAEMALASAVPAARDARTAALEADLAETGIIGGMLKAAQQSLAGGSGFETSLDRIARTGRAPTMPEIVALSRQAYTPEDQEYVVQLALESGLVRGRTLAEQRDTAGMYNRVLPLLKFPDRGKKSSLEVYGDVLQDAGTYIRSRYGNDPEMFRALAKGMADAGLIDIKQADSATKEFTAANRAAAQAMTAAKPVRPPSNIRIGGVEITTGSEEKLPVPKTPGEEADTFGRRASAEEDAQRKAAMDADAKDSEYRQAASKFGPNSASARKALDDRNALRAAAIAAGKRAAELRKEEDRKRKEQLEYEKRGERTERSSRKEKM